MHNAHGRTDGSRLIDIGFVGLGRMGGAMVERLLRGGHRVVAYNRTPEKLTRVVDKGAVGVGSLEELCATLKAPRIIWLMVPQGDPVTENIAALLPHLSRGDMIVDGGNSYYKDSVRRAAELSQHGIEFADAGTSGGVWGLEKGYCMMVGASDDAFARLAPAVATLAPPDGYLHTGPAGSGHYVKMVHNGVEYAMMQSYGEGFELMKEGPFDVDLSAVAALWNRGSVVRSWLLELAESALAKDPELSDLSAWVEDSGEGRWTVLQAIEDAVPAPTIAMSLFARFASRQESSFSLRMLAALRREFGGHAVKTGSEVPATVTEGGSV